MGDFGSTPRDAALLLSTLNEYLDRMKHHGRRRLKIRDTIVYECQRLAGRLLRGLDDDQDVDLSVFDLAAELAGESSALTSVSGDQAASSEERVAIDSATLDENGADRGDDPPRQQDAGTPGGANGRASQLPATFDEEGNSDVDLGDL